MSADRLFIDLNNACSKLLRYPSRDILLIFHDDADGISSGAILYKALRDMGFNIKLVCIEKLMDQIIKYIHSGSERIIIYADIGSPHADKISKYNMGKNLVIILDHHDPRESTDPEVLNINPEFYGMEGERDASGSVMAYLFAKALDESNINLAYIALIGAQEIPTGIGTLTRIAYEDSRRYQVNIDYKEMFKILQILGSVGYYDNGPIEGIKVCLEGISDDIRQKIKRYEEMRKNANRRMLSILHKYGLRRERYIQWFDSYNVYSGMGTKVIGTFCSYLSYQRRLIDDMKYIIGLMKMPNEIPGLMKLEGMWVKISGRAPERLRRLIESGRYPGLVDFMVPASEEVGGIGDGHKYAASVVIPLDKRFEYIKLIDSIIDEMLKSKK